MIRGFVVDDEEFATKRLARMLAETGRVTVAGTSNDPVDAIAWLSSNSVDVVFLDIQMPGMSGFEMLRVLDPQPVVVFTTAFDQYALKAFEANSVDYLLKPVEPEHLDRSLSKLERLTRRDIGDLIGRIQSAIGAPPAYLDRIASKVGDRFHLIELARITQFYAEDKLTYAAVKGKNHPVDYTMSELESKLDPRCWYRIHRSTVVNLDWVREMDQWFSGMVVRLKDEGPSELPVARDRVRGLKERLGL